VRYIINTSIFEQQTIDLGLESDEKKNDMPKKDFMKLNYIAVFHEYFFGLQCQYYWKNP